MLRIDKREAGDKWFIFREAQPFYENLWTAFRKKYSIKFTLNTTLYHKKYSPLRIEMIPDMQDLQFLYRQSNLVQMSLMTTDLCFWDEMIFTLMYDNW